MNIFTIPGKPIPWKRARMCGRRFFDVQAEQKKEIQKHLLNACEGDFPLTGGLKITIEYHMRLPKSWSADKRANMLNKPHVSTPDLSNLIKFTEDALNKMVWMDDKLIYEIHARKFYSDVECTRFIVEEYYEQKRIGSLIPQYVRVNDG